MWCPRGKQTMDRILVKLRLNLFAVGFQSIKGSQRGCIRSLCSSMGSKESHKEVEPTSDPIPEAVEQKKRPPGARTGEELTADHIKDYTTPRGRKPRRMGFKESILPQELAELRFKFPEFLPVEDPGYRHKIAHRLERMDMLNRRNFIDIPEFYVGSILGITVSDPFAPGKESRFVGICISREGHGLRANFTLRNYIENEGVEIRYDLYNPTLRTIEVLKLEKRLDSHLLYLRDADPIHSTFPFDMQPEPLPPGIAVPVNPLRVKMKPYPWTQRWEVEYPLIQGFEKLENVPDWYYERSRKAHNPLEKFDLMMNYRENVPEEDQLEIWQQVKHYSDQVAEKRKQERRKKLLRKDKPDAAQSAKQ